MRPLATIQSVHHGGTENTEKGKSKILNHEEHEGTQRNTKETRMKPKSKFLRLFFVLLCGSPCPLWFKVLVSLHKHTNRHKARDLMCTIL
ncbi:MAG: hypothetical protein JWO20_2498 [Candidatus Angelobacter sp.]|jgi:hypothetical protein|nr:hypothetical protein [Candidatus Angelobacter sp.]